MLSDYRWQECPDSGRSTLSCIVFYRGVPIDHCKHSPGPFSQYSSESEYNAECTVTDSSTLQDAEY